MADKLCMGCMETYNDKYDVCPHCGYVDGTAPKEAYHLIPGTVIEGRYIVGKVIGNGGFGVSAGRIFNQSYGLTGCDSFLRRERRTVCKWNYKVC